MPDKFLPVLEAGDAYWRWEIERLEQEATQRRAEMEGPQGEAARSEGKATEREGKGEMAMEGSTEAGRLGMRAGPSGPVTQFGQGARSDAGEAGGAACVAPAGVSPPGSPGKGESRDQVFISYARKDKRWLEQLLEMLTPLAREGKLDVWSDQRIQAGAPWREEIKSALGRAKVAVLLVTPAFLASEFVAKNELPPLLEAAKGEGVTIVWIAVRHSLYQHTPIEGYQCANDPAHPLQGLSATQRDRTLKEVAERVLAAAQPGPR
jgi:hypothetical protein